MARFAGLFHTLGEITVGFARFGKLSEDRAFIEREMMRLVGGEFVGGFSQTVSQEIDLGFESGLFLRCRGGQKVPQRHPLLVECKREMGQCRQRAGMRLIELLVCGAHSSEIEYADDAERTRDRRDQQESPNQSGTQAGVSQQHMILLRDAIAIETAPIRAPAMS